MTVCGPMDVLERHWRVQQLRLAACLRWLMHLSPNRAQRYLKRRLLPQRRANSCWQLPLMVLPLMMFTAALLVSLSPPGDQQLSAQLVSSGRRRAVRDLSRNLVWALTGNAGDVKDSVTPQDRGKCSWLQDDDNHADDITSDEQLTAGRFTECQVNLLYFGSSRLGNLLIKYSMLYSLRQKYKINVYLTNEQTARVARYFDRLSITALPAEYKNASWHFTWYNHMEFILPCPENIGRKLSCFPHAPHEHCIVIADWPPENGFPVFTPYIQDLITEFTFKQHVRDQVQDYLQRIAASRNVTTFVGVHVRATDQNVDFLKNYNRPLPSGQFYASAMSYCRSTLPPPVVFVVATDDRRFAVENIDTIAGDVFFTAGENGVVDDVIFDLAALANMNHTVVSVGTYGFWGSLLAGGTVVAPSSYAGVNTSLYDVEVKRWDRQREWFTWS